MSAIRTYDGAVALITGGASGIGAALSRQLAVRGATVVVADRQVELARQTAGALRRPGEAHELDVRDAAAFDWLLEDLFARHGRLDYLFNNAGRNRADQWSREVRGKAVVTPGPSRYRPP